MRAHLCLWNLTLITAFGLYCDKSMLPDIMERMHPKPVNNIVTIAVVYHYKRAKLRAAACCDGGVLQVTDDGESLFLIRGNESDEYTIVDFVSTSADVDRVKEFGIFQAWWKSLGYDTVPLMLELDLMSDWVTSLE